MKCTGDADAIILTPVAAVLVFAAFVVIALIALVAIARGLIEEDTADDDTTPVVEHGYDDDLSTLQGPDCETIFIQSDASKCDSNANRAVVPYLYP